MPNIADPERAALIKKMAKKESVAAAQALLELAIKWRDKKRIQTATAMLDAALKENFEADTKPKNFHIPKGYDGVSIALDAVLSSPKQGPRSVKCKPEDCPKCFWLNWCETKDSFDVLMEAQQVLRNAKSLTLKKYLPNQSPLKEYLQTGSAEADKGQAEDASSPLPHPSDLPWASDAAKKGIQFKRDWRIIRKEAQETLKRMKRDN